MIIDPLRFEPRELGLDLAKTRTDLTEERIAAITGIPETILRLGYEATLGYAQTLEKSKVEPPCKSQKI